MDNSGIENREGNSVPDPWQNPQNTSKEIKDRHQTVDYAQIVAENRVLFLAEDHINHPIRDHIVQHARDIKAAGITHYAIEANEAGNAVFERLNRGETVDLSKVDVGPDRTDYEEAIRALAAQGIKVIAIDIDQNTKPSEEEREARLTDNINKILQQDPNSKVAVLIGGFHTTRHYVSEGVPSVGRRFMKAQVPAVNIHFVGGEVKSPLILTNGASEAGLSSQEFMIDFRPYSNLERPHFGKGEADWVVHLPQQAPFLGSRLDSGRLF